jgi:hypothetical protein
MTPKLCATVSLRCLFCAALFSLLATADANAVKVRLNNLDIGIDDATGSIVSLTSPYTAELLAANSEAAGLLDLAYPTESFTAMRLASRFSKATILRPSPDEIDIEWNRLGASRSNLLLPSGGVKALVTIKAASDGRSVIFTCHIDNQSGASVRQTLFPDLWGLKPVAGVKTTRLRLARAVVHPFDAPLIPLDTAPEYYRGLGWKVYPAGSYYQANSLRWLDYGGFDGGLSVFQKKWGSGDWPDVLTQRRERDPNSLRLAWEQQQEIAPGQSWDSGEFWFTPHAGGWAKGIEVYRTYVNQVNPPSSLPADVRDDIGFQTIWMIQTAEVDPKMAAFRFTDLPRVAADAKHFGIHEVVPWGWCTYSTLPIPPRPELGSEADLLRAVQQSREMGVNIAPFISIDIVRNRYAARYNAPVGSEDWTYHPELIPMFRPYYTKFWDGAMVDTNNKLWEQDVITALRDWINKGLTSFVWDVFAVKDQANEPPGLVMTIDKVRKLARAKYAESTFAAESVTHLEYDSQILDYTWNWLDYQDAAPITSVLRSPRLNCNVEASPTVVEKCFADNLFLNIMPRKPDQPNGTALISDAPDLASAISTVANLRRQFLPYFVSGIFIGDSVLAHSVDAFVRGYQLNDKLLVVALNTDDQPKSLTIQSDLNLWLPPAKIYTAGYYDADGRRVAETSTDQARWTGATRKLKPGELALVEIQAK